MKKEVEFSWIIHLLNSKFVKSNFLGNPSGVYKKDFEDVCGVSTKNRIFRLWLNRLIKEEILEFAGVGKTRGGSFDTYLINKKKLDEKLRENFLYNPTITYLEKNKFLLRTSK